MDRDTKLSLVVQARKRAELCDAAIAAQLAIIRKLERDGADTTTYRSNLTALLAAQDEAMASLEQFPRRDGRKSA